MRNKHKITKNQMMIVIFLLQGIIGFIILNVYMTKDIVSWQVSNAIPISYATLNIIGVIGIQRVLDLFNKEAKYQHLLSQLKKSDEVLYMLRAQKHDFLNHLQVIMGLAQLDKTDRIVSYVHNISQDVIHSYSIANIGIPEIAVVLMQKLGEATHRGICVETQIMTSCEGLRGEGLVYAQILFNLLDNAIFELDELGDCEKILRVEMEEGKGYFQFIIFNNLPIIPEKHIASLFERGYTTKEGNHDGLGLWNVEKLVHANNGMIKVESRPEYGTAFKIIIPK